MARLQRCCGLPVHAQVGCIVSVPSIYFCAALRAAAASGRGLGGNEAGARGQSTRNSVLACLTSVVRFLKPEELVPNTRLWQLLTRMTYNRDEASLLHTLTAFKHVSQHAECAETILASKRLPPQLRSKLPLLKPLRKAPPLQQLHRPPPSHHRPHQAKKGLRTAPADGPPQRGFCRPRPQRWRRPTPRACGLLGRAAK